MRKLMMTLVLVSVLAIAFSSVAFADGINPAKFCKDGGTELIATALENALYEAHGVEVDLDISQGACASTIATHNSANGVNTTGLAVDFCKQVIEEFSVSECVEHVQPTLFDIFHGE